MNRRNTLRATLAFLYLFSSVGMLLLLHLDEWEWATSNSKLFTIPEKVTRWSLWDRT